MCRHRCFCLGAWTLGGRECCLHVIWALPVYNASKTCINFCCCCKIDAERRAFAAHRRGAGTSASPPNKNSLLLNSSSSCIQVHTRIGRTSIGWDDPAQEQVCGPRCGGFLPQGTMTPRHKAVRMSHSNQALSSHTNSATGTLPAAIKRRQGQQHCSGFSLPLQTRARGGA